MQMPEKQPPAALIDALSESTWCFKFCTAQLNPEYYAQWGRREGFLQNTCLYTQSREDLAVLLNIMTPDKVDGIIV